MKCALLNWHQRAESTRRIFQLLSRRDDGQDLIEYALLMAFMVIAVYVILPSDLMPAINSLFSKVISAADRLTNHSG